MKNQLFSYGISMSKIKVLAILGFILMASQYGQAQVNSKKYVLPEALIKKFDTHFKTPLFDKEADINRLLEAHNIPSVALGLINNGALQQIRVFGNNHSGVPVSYNSIYKVASLTKPVTALVALKLVNANKWDLDEPIFHFYIDDDIKDSAELEKLTTRHILSHQTGFPNWRYLNESQKLSFEFEPGTQYQYSGEGFEYLRKALEHKFNKPLEDLAKELIFDPLGMNDTNFYWSENVDAARYAVEHDEKGNPIEFEKYTKANAAANLLTTVRDYGIFMSHILNGAGLSKSLYSEMISKQVSVKTGVDFGLGLQIINELGNGEYALQHTGGDYGTKTIAVLFPKSKRGIIIFSNSENGMVIWKKIMEEYFGDIANELIRKNLNN